MIARARYEWCIGNQRGLPAMILCDIRSFTLLTLGTLLLSVTVAEVVAQDSDRPAIARPLIDGEAAVDCGTLEQKVMVGYQGWFNCPADGSDLGWKHWAKRPSRPFAPGNVTVDLWPDMSELGPNERFATAFQLADGRAAEVFSSANQETVDRHFRWMGDYGIDGAFLQRFAVGLSNPARRRNNDVVLSNVRHAAAESGRAFAVMYDLSGLKAGMTQVVAEDWKRLRETLQLTKDATYLQHGGKPLVAVWGIGFGDERSYTLAECDALVRQLKDDGCSVMIGVPSFWRQGTRDSSDDPKRLELISNADIVSPWTVGRYRTPKQALRHADSVWATDQNWCDERRIAYLPVAFPGFSWNNLHGGELDAIPRAKGEFLWAQIEGAKKAGCKMVYVAMFDEVDEGTAIFKCTNEPPVSADSKFLTYQGLSSDYYLRLVGRAGQLLRDEIPVGSTTAFPIDFDHDKAGAE